MSDESQELTEINVGCDRVVIGDETVTIHARHEMPDWKVREFCIVPILFRDHKFFLQRREPGPAPYAFQYVLAPWYLQLGAESGHVIHYDEDYVAAREGTVRRESRFEHLHHALFLIYPFLGFCWSGFKERVLGQIGFEARSITEASIMLAFCFWMLEGIFVFYFHAGLLGMLFGLHLLFLLDYLLLLAVPLDCAMRFGQVLEGYSIPGGVFEWLFRRHQRNR